MKSNRKNNFKKVNFSVKARLLALVLIPALLLVSLFGGGTIIPPALAQINLCGGASANRIFQGCPLGDPDYEISLENQAIDDMLNVHQLPPTDRSRLMGWQRGALRALIYAHLTEAIKKAPNDRTAAEKAALNALAGYVKSKRVEAAQAAVDEYNRWRQNQCNYQPPTGFSYSGAAQCAGARINIAAEVDPPKFEEFEAYGAALAFGKLQERSVQRELDETIQRAAFFGGLGGGAISGAAISAVFPQAILKAIFPFASRAFSGIGGGAAAGLGGATAAIGGAVFVVVAAVVISVLRGIDVTNIAAIPGKLQTKLNEAQSVAPPDLAQLIATENGQREVFADFALMTLPDFPANDSIPAAQTSDPKFRVRLDGAGADSVAAQINFKSWDNDTQSARANGGWLINKYHEDNLDKERWTLTIKYLNWRNEAWIAGRSGAGFIHTKLDDPTQTFESAEIKYLDASGNKTTASLILPQLDISTLPIVAVRDNEPVGGGVPTPKRFAVAIVNTDGQAPDTLGVSVNNAASATVTGVSVSNLRIDAAGRVTADLAAICGASVATFMLRITDSAQSKTIPLTVRLSPVVYSFDETGNVLSNNLPNGALDTDYKGFISPSSFFQFCTVNAGYTVAVTDGQLPPGLSLDLLGNEINAPRGVIGTPTVGGTYNFTVKMTFGTGDSFTRDYSIKIDSTPVLLPDGAISWWSAERGVLDDLKRGHGRLNNGFAVPDFAPGKVGLAFSFNGYSNAMQMPDNYFFTSDNSQPFTFETWFKTASYGVIFGRQDTDAFDIQPDNYSPGIYVGNDGKLRAQMFFNGEKNPITSEAAVNDDKFHHVAVVYDGVEQIVYLDGVEIGRARYTPGGASVYYKYQLGTGYAAGYPSASSVTPWFGFRGLIDEPTLYGSILTADQIKSIYAAGSAGKIFVGTTNYSPTCPGASNGFLKVDVIGGAAPFTYSFDGGATFLKDNVPDFGLSAGTHTVIVKDVFGRTFNASATITDPQPISINPDSLASFINPGQPLTQNFQASGGTGIKTLTLTGALPNGLIFTNDSSNSAAKITGTPTQSGSFPITINATDGGCGVSQNYTLVVNAAPTIASASPLSRQQGASGIASTIATVGDDLTTAGNLGVTVTSAPNGISVANIVNTNGTITANVAAACGAKLGANVIGLKVTDGGGLTATANLTINVTASSPPVIALKPFAAMSPPNHKYQTFTVSQMVESAVDGCDGDLSGNVVIEKVTSDEADNAPGDSDGNTTNDIVIGANCKSVQLRAERDDGGNGRVYVVTLRVTDSSGNVVRTEYKASVPLNKNGASAIQDAPSFTVKSSCF